MAVITRVNLWLLSLPDLPGPSSLPSSLFLFFGVRNASPRTFLVFPSFDSCGTQLETSHSLLENNVESENTKICVRKPAVSHSDTKRIQLDIVPLMRNCNYRSRYPPAMILCMHFACCWDVTLFFPRSHSREYSHQ